MGAHCAPRFQRFISLGVGVALFIAIVGVLPGSLKATPAAAASYPPVSVWVGYADSLRANGFFPNPWQGSANVVFEGCTGSCTYDGGAIRIENPTSGSLTIQQVSVDIGSGCTFAIWPSNMTVPAGQSVILTQEGSGASSGCSQGNLFDSSDAPSITCTADGILPVVHITINGVTTSYKDTRQILNTRGIDPATCNGTNESHQWEQVGGGPSIAETRGGGSPSVRHQTTCRRGRYPINCVTGEFYHTFADLIVPGRGPALAFTRTYSSLGAAQLGPLGFGWTDSYNMSLSIDPNNGDVTINEEGGSQVSFTPVPTGYEAPGRVMATLVKNGDGTYTFTRYNGRQFLFSGSGQLLRETDRNGYSTSLTYDSKGLLTTVTDPAGRSLTMTYSGGLLSSVRDPANRTVSFVYDTNGNLVAATDVNGGVTRFTYDSNHLLLSMTDPRGGVVTNVYDSSGRVTSQTDPMSRTTTFDYTTTGTTITDPRGNVDVQQYQDNELVSTTEGYGTAQAATWSYSYDQSTLGVTSMTDPNNHTWTYTYDANGNLLTSTDPLNHSATYTYDSLDDMTSSTDPSGITTSMTFDSAGNLLSISRPLTSTSQTQQTTFAYGDSAHPGDLTSIVDPTGDAWSFAYDSTGDVVSMTDPLGDKTTMTYDAIGRPVTLVSPKGNVTGGNPSAFMTAYTYDPFGDLTKVTDPLNHTTTSSYDADGNRVSVTDPLGKQTTFAYDLDNELTIMTRPDHTTQTNGYDAAGNLTSQANGLGNATTYAFDALNRPVSTTDPLNRVTSLAYDGAGNTISVTNAAGQVTSYTYDAANELTGTNYSDGKTPNVSYTYDALGERLTMVDGSGTSHYAYDSLNRLIQSSNGAGQTVGYGYDLGGRLTTLTYPGGQVLKRDYDAVGQLTSVTDWLGHASTFSYDADGNLTTESYANSTQATYAYDAADQMTSITDAKAGSSFGSFTYTRDANGQVTSETSSGLGQANQSYSYDQVNRLTGVNGSSYAYNAADEIITLPSGASLAYDAAGQLSSLTHSGIKTSFNYDANGNRLTGLSPEGTAATYSYDQANRLTSFQTTPPAASTLLSGGEYHNLAVRADGTLWAWGYNAFGQLGNGTTTNSSVPLQVPGIVGATGVAAGDMHSVLLKSDGSVWTWGFNGSGQLGNGTTTSASTPVQVSGVAGATEVAAGNNHTLVRKSDGTVMDWGQNDAGQLGNGTTTNSSVPVTVTGLTGVSAVAGGGLPGAPGHSLALKSDGSVWAWGYNRYGQLGNGSTSNSWSPVQVNGLTGITAIAANGNDSYALKSDGTVWSWGDNSSGQLGNASSVKTSPTPVQVSLSGATSIAAGGAFAFAVKSDGTAWAWGNDSGWQLGDGGKCGKGCNAPVQITGLSGVAAMSGGYTHGLAITSSGNVEAWGQNGSGQLGNGSTTPSSTPVQTSNLSNVKRAPASASYTYDGDSLRASKTVSGITSKYAWDLASGTLLLSDGSMTYVYGPNGMPLEQVSGTGAVQYFHQDQLGSTRMLTDGSGSVVATYGYDPYGNVTALTGNSGTALTYAGQYTDAETGFQYLRARYYDALTGQFVSRDPEASLTNSSYGYGSESPTNFTDPTGLCSWAPWASDFCGKQVVKTVSKVAGAVSTITSVVAVGCAIGLAVTVVGETACAAVEAVSVITGFVALAGDLTLYFEGDPDVTAAQVILDCLGLIPGLAVSRALGKASKLLETAGVLQEIAPELKEALWLVGEGRLGTQLGRILEDVIGTLRTKALYYLAEDIGANLIGAGTGVASLLMGGKSSPSSVSSPVGTPAPALC